MPVYRVLAQQYVERVAAVDVEAETPEAARDLALATRFVEAIWEDGDDAGAVEVYAVMQGAAAVWER